MLRISIFVVGICLAMQEIKGDLMAPRQCEPIRIELCRGIGYNETSMPNLVGHELQTDADLTLQTFAPLISYGCSAQLLFFLCSAYVPMCTPKVPVPIGPCRSLCETVQARCHPVLEGFGFPWPAALDCNHFPVENNHQHMCMEGPGEPNDSPIGGFGTGGVNNIIPGNKNLATPISKITLSHQPASCQGLTKSHLYVRLNRSGRCAPLCEADILFDQREKHLAEIWVNAWSYAALATAIIATLCLIFSDTKWDKILTPLVTCHSLVAVGWTVRFLSGRNPSACGFDPQLPNVSLLLIDGLSNASCAATFLLRYYFGMSAGVWWSILCLEWHRGIRRTRNDFNESPAASSHQPLPLPSQSQSSAAAAAATATTTTAANNKSNNVMHKSKDNYTNLAQLAAWGLPALQTGAVLVARLVDADELFGACFVGNQSDKALRILVATPLFCYWIFGSVNLFAGYLVYRRNKKIPNVVAQLPTINHHHHHHHLHHTHHNHLHHHNNNNNSNSNQLAATSMMNLNGVGTFLFIYCIPSALLLISVFYEFANSDIWLNLPQPSYEPIDPVKAPMWPFMMRAFMELLLGVVSSAWVLGPRISTAYKIRFAPKYKQTPTKSYAPTTAYSTASYQTVCQPSTVISMDKMSRYPSTRTKYPQQPPPQPPPHHSRNKPSRSGYKLSSRSLSHYGNETIL